MTVFVRPQIDNDLLRCLVYLPHEGDLMAFLVQVVLIDANAIDPETAGCRKQSQILEYFVKICRDFQNVPIANNVLILGAFSPYV